MRTKNMSAVVILSGGMDSTTLLYDTLNRGYKVRALSFNYGQRHVRELEYAKATCTVLKIQHKVVDLTPINSLLQGSALTSPSIKVPRGHYTSPSMKATVVPNRNMILLSLAIGYAISIKANHVFYGAHAGDHSIYPDCRREFVTAMQRIARICDYRKIRLHAPYLRIDKGDIVIIGKKLKVDYSSTWTCYDPKEDKACGHCGACTERLEAFKKAGIKDPIKYVR